WSCAACATRCSRDCAAAGKAVADATVPRTIGRRVRRAVSEVSGGARHASRAPSGSVVDQLEQIALDAWVLRLAEPEDRLLSQLGVPLAAADLHQLVERRRIAVL